MSSFRELAILGACAMPHGHPRQRAHLEQLLDGDVPWNSLIDVAVRENMTGLLWHHVHPIGGVPADASLRLMGLRLRQRRLIRVQEEAVLRLLDVAAQSRVDVMLLKGAALRQVVYPDPELRVMRDIDVLASQEGGRTLFQALREAGFLATDRGTHPIHHPVLEWRRGPYRVGVDIHWIAHRKQKAGFRELAADGVQIEISGRPVWIPSPLDMLRHVFLHCFGSDPWLGGRLVAVADLVAMLEIWGPAFDVDGLSRQDRALVRALGWLDLLAPLPDAVRGLVGPITRSGGVGEFYRGWPLDSGAHPFRSWNHCRATFAPSPWWLRLRFRARAGRSSLAWAWARHMYGLAEVWW